jgi:plasmid stabilization system protein ParE
MRKKSFSIEISDEAEIDFDKSYEYYFEGSQKVADSFFKRINLSLENIRKNPMTFPKAFNDIRKFVVKKFPFVIYYQVFDSEIRVIAIFHSSRTPKFGTNEYSNSDRHSQSDARLARRAFGKRKRHQVTQSIFRKLLSQSKLARGQTSIFFKNPYQ